MRTWSEEESWQHVERFRGYRGDKRCRKCSWFGHMAHQCRRKEIEAEREQRGGLQENRWRPLEYRVMRCDEEREVACSMRREAQQEVRCWGCGKVGHCLWTCPKGAAHPSKGEVQQEGRTVCRVCRGENHIARNCDTYWRWREQDLKEEVKKLKERRIEEFKESKGAEGKGKRRRKSSEAHNTTSKSGVDESGLRKGRHP